MLVSWIRGRIVVKVAFAIIDSTLAIVEAFIFVDVNVFVFTHSIISSSAILVAIIVEELELNIIDVAFAVFVVSFEYAIVIAAMTNCVVCVWGSIPLPIYVYIGSFSDPAEMKQLGTSIFWS